MYIQERFEYSEREFLAVKLYEGGRMTEKQDEFYCQKSAYRTLNLLMMAGSEGERVRVCIEGQKPNSLFLRRWKQTVEVLTDIFAVSCRYAIHRACQGIALPFPLSRGEREVNFLLMKDVGSTFAFTSVTEGEWKESFIKLKHNPHVLHITLCERVPYLDFADFLGDAYYYTNQKEILLPPMIQMECGSCVVQEHKKIGLVCHYDIKLTGFCTEIVFMDEGELIECLESCVEEAVGGVVDLVRNGLDAKIFRDKEHLYWKWKSAFRQLTIQRMNRIYKEYYIQ